VDQSVSCSSHFRNTHFEKVTKPEAAALCIFVTNPVFSSGVSSLLFVLLCARERNASGAGGKTELIKEKKRRSGEVFSFVLFGCVFHGFLGFCVVLGEAGGLQWVARG
jgi:hypothetical protein